MTLDVLVVWVFLLHAQIHGDLKVTQIAMFSDRAICERVREANPPHAVSPACFITQAMTVRER